MSLFARYQPISIGGGGGGGGVTSIGTLDGTTPSADGAVIVGAQLFMQSASLTVPGLVNTTTQSFAGNKTFSGSITASNLSGTNTGDVTLAVFGSTPANAGASLSGQVLTLQPADATHGGGVSTTTQSFAGNKTFTGSISASNLSGTNTGDITLTAVGSSANANGVSLSGQVLTLQPATTSFPGVLTAADWNTFNNKQPAGTYVTSLTVTTGNGISGSFTAGATPALSLTLGAITPTTVNGNTFTAGSGTLTLSTFTLTVTATASVGGTNTGDVTLGVFGSAPDAKGATISGQVVTMQPGDATHPGMVTTAAQTMAGVKTFSSAPVVSTLTASQVVVSDSGKALASQAYAITPAASTISEWDANVNFSANNFLEGYRNTTTAAGTTTLVIGDSLQQVFSGSTTQTCKLPVASTLVLGHRYVFYNLSSGVVTVQSSGANTIQAMATNTQLVATCILTSGTGTASWAWVYSSISAALPMTNPMTTGGDLIYGGASGVPTRLANGSANQLLQSNGTTTAPTWVTPLALTTTTSTSPGTSRNFSTITSGGYGAMSGGSVSLAAGTWEIDSYYEANTGTGVTCVMYANSGLYAANGADSGSAPAALSTIGTVSGPATFADTTGGATVASAAAGAGWSVHLTTVLTVASTQTVYAVPRVDFATAGTAAATVYIFARRIY